MRPALSINNQHKEITVKNLFSCILAAGAIMAAAAFIAPATAQAADGVPCVVALTLPGGSTNVAVVSTNTSASWVPLGGSNVYTVGFTADARSSLKPLAYQYAINGTLATAGTITFSRSPSGPIFATVTVATNALSAVSFESNAWYFIRGDTIYTKASFTNSGSVAVIGLEQ